MITGDILRDGIVSGANNIVNNKNAVNALNVFPVPDGDTGTNMSMTMMAAKKAMENIGDGADAGFVAEKAAAAMLRGARGNSGVILSLIFRGMADGLKGCEAANGAILAAALDLGSAKAYKAVSNPVEGTILTVVKSAAASARDNCTKDIDAAETFEAAYKGAAEALAKTPDMLHVLRKAKVVDAGGQGLCYIFLGMLSVFLDNKIIECKEDDSTEASAVSGGEVMSAEDIKFAYCNEFIVRKKDDLKKSADKLKKYLMSIGDCVVVVEDDEIIKVHVHSNDPGKVLSAGLEYGEFLNVKVDNMREQHRSAYWGAPSSDKEEKKIHAAPEKKYGFIAVSSGSGFEELFAELGADKVVSGGQTMNPSTEDILDAVNEVPAETVFVLPNNKNIIMASRQAGKLCDDKKVIVLETKSVPQGIAACLAFDPDCEEAENKENMAAAVAEVQTVSVTYAARDSFAGGMNIKKGQCMGLENGEITVISDDPNEAAYKTVRRTAKRWASVITVYYGDSVTEEKAQSLADSIAAKYSAAEVTVVNGGQPVYHYIISVE